MLVTEAIGQALADLGVDTAFGLVGSGNFHVTNALIARGTRFIAARHESGAASMADGWARITGRAGVLSLHQGPGITNALTALTEAAKARTPLLVLAADVSPAAKLSNFRIDVAAISAGIGATPARLHSAGLAVDDVVRAYRTAERERRCVILALPLDVQASECTWPGVAGVEGTAGPGTLAAGAWALAAGPGAVPPPAQVAALARRLAAALRLHRIIQAVELSFLILVAAIADAATGGLTATRVLDVAALAVGALMAVAHLVAIMASRRLR